MKLNQLPDDRDLLEHDLQHHYTELTTTTATTKMDCSSGNEDGGADGQEPPSAAGGDSGTRRTSTRMKKPVIPISITHEPKKTRKRKNSQGKPTIQRKRRSNTNLKTTKTTVASPSNGNYSSFDEDDNTNNDEFRPKSHNYNKSNNYRTSFESSMSSFVDDDDDSRHYTNGNNMITFPNTSINSSIVNHHHRNNNNNNVTSNKASHLNANKASNNFSHGNLMTNVNFVKSPKADYSRKNTSNSSAIAAQKKQQSNVTSTRAVVPTKPQIPVINLNSDDEDEDDSDDESQEEDDSRSNSTSFVAQKLSSTVPSRVVQLPHLSHSQFRVPESAKLAASKVKSIFPTPLASLLSICPPPPLSSLNRSSLSSTKPASAPFSVKTNNNNHNNNNHNNNTSSPQTTAVQKQPQGDKPKRKRAPRKPKLNQSKPLTSDPPTKSAVKRRRSRSKSNLNTTTKQISFKSPSKPVSKPNTGPIKPGPIPATNPLTLNSVKSSLSIGQSVRPCLLVSFQQPVVPPPPLPVEPVKYPVKLAIHRSRVVGPVVRIDKQQSSNKKTSKTTKNKNSKQKQPDSLNSTESAPVPIQYSLVNKLNEDSSANSGTGAGVAGAGGSAISRVKKQLNQRLTTVTETSTDDWKCALCHQKPQSKFLGDLYGPYFVQKQLTNPLNSHLSKTFSLDSSKQVSKYCSSMASQPISGQQTEVWVHEDCIVWSNVYAIGSKICNLDTAIQESLHNCCRICGHPGASLACFVKDCYYSALHFPCAKEISCYFNEDNFTLFCPHHFGILHQQQQPQQIGGQQSNATSTSTTGSSNSRTPQAVNIAAVASCSSARTKIF